MTDGILDLLSAILVMGVVLMIAFNFITPLTDTEYMGFDTQYKDKGEVSNIVDYSNPETFKDIDKRKYTYEELMLLLRVQDSKMDDPKYVNLRNLVVYDNLGYTGYNGGENGYQSNKIISPRINTAFTTYNSELWGNDNVYKAILRFAKNENFPHNNKLENDNQFIGGGLEFFDDRHFNVGAFELTSTFLYESGAIVDVLNGIDYINHKEGGEMKVTPNYGSPNNIVYIGTDLTNPEDKAEYEKRKIFYINHHFAIPNYTNEWEDPNSTVKNVYLEGLPQQFLRRDDDFAQYFVEIEGKKYWGVGVKTPDNPNSEIIDTKAEYENYLADLRSRIEWDRIQNK